MRRFAAVLFLAAVCAGCSTTLTRLPVPKGLTTDDVRPLETVEVSNAALLLLSCIPIASGDPSAPNCGAVSWFTDTTTLANQMRMLEDEAARVGATRALEVQTRRTDESLFLFLVLREKIHTSAVLAREVTE